MTRPSKPVHDLRKDLQVIGVFRKGRSASAHVLLERLQGQPATPIQTLNQVVVDKQKTPYLMDFRVVSGDKLNSVDYPVDHMVGLAGSTVLQGLCEGFIGGLSQCLPILEGVQGGLVDTIVGSTQSHEEETDASDYHDHADH